MGDNRIINFILEGHSFISKILYYFKLKKEIINYDTLNDYFNFLNYLEKIFFYNNSMKSPISTHFNNTGKYIILVDKAKNQIYISCKSDGELSIRIYRKVGHDMESNIKFNYSEFDKVTAYDKFIIESIFRTVKLRISSLYLEYV